MRLNLDILEAWLPKDWHIKRFGPEKHDLSLGRPRLYVPGVSMTPESLYLVQAELLPAVPPDIPCSFVCIGRQIPKPYLTAEIPVLLLANSRNLAEIYNRIQEIYDRFDAWDSQLRDELEKDADFDIQRLLLLATDFFQRMVSVVDSNLQQLFCAAFDLQKGAHIMKHTGPMPLEHNEQIKEVCSLERIIRTPYQTSLNLYGHAYCNNLYISDQFCGCISINEFDRCFQPWEFPVMAHFFSYFRNGFFKYLRGRSNSETPELRTLRGILSGRTLSEEDQNVLCLSPEEQWICFRLCENQKERALPLDYMFATLNAALPKKVCAVIYHEKIVGLIRVRAQSPYDLDRLAAFADTVARMGYCAGLSNAFSSLPLIQDYLRQAAYALHQEAETSPVLRFFRDCTLDYMLDSCVGEQSMEGLLTCGLKSLIEHDQQKGSEYLHTLDLYLQNEMSISRTAGALFIHRSSLLKRLDKIFRILESKLDKPEERLYLRLCLELLRKSKNTNL